MADSAPRKGDVHIVDFGAAGEGILKIRPGIVVSVDSINRHAFHVTVAPVRSAAGKEAIPLHAFIPAGEGGLRNHSLADVGLLAAVPKEKLGRRIGRLGPAALERVDAAIRFYFGV